MIKKQFVKTRQVTKLTFELPKDIEFDNIHLLAEFNNWEPVAFEHLKNGKWKLVQEVSKAGAYEFRYMSKQDEDYHFFNDDSADQHVDNALGTTNSVVECQLAS
jgi:hypothetical protein